MIFSGHSLRLVYSTGLCHKHFNSTFGRFYRHYSNRNTNETTEAMDRPALGRGKVSPTASRLFKLTLPLDKLIPLVSTTPGPLSVKQTLASCSSPAPTNELQPSYGNRQSPQDPPLTPAIPPTIFLLHPSQPLSHASHLIRSSILQSQSYKRAFKSSSFNDQPTISFRNASIAGDTYQWSDSTDLADFMREASRVGDFTIVIEYPRPSDVNPNSNSNIHTHPDSDGAINTSTSSAVPSQNKVNVASPPASAPERPTAANTITTSLHVDVPTFADRTHYLRRQLKSLEARLASMSALKEVCDKEARRGAQRMAMAGFGILVVYWGAVARLTFWDYGWDVMEPVTYLSGLSTVVVGYLWFLYQGREVSYTSVLHHSISARREALYKARGFDIELWMDTIKAATDVRKEIARIKEDYEEDVEKVEERRKEREREKEKEQGVDETEGDPVAQAQVRQSVKESNLIPLSMKEK